MEHPEAVTWPRPSFTLRTLGSIGVYGADGTTSLIPAGKPTALLVYLAALPAQRANREHLLSLLWADLEPDRARHALRQTIWYLRQRVGEQVLTATDDDLLLAAVVETDRERFLGAIETGDLGKAVEIYRGEFLSGFAVPGGLAFEQWADAERQRLRMLFRHAAESLARDELKQGHFRAARDLARRARDADPFDEAGWRLLIEVSLAQGDRVSALAEGQRLLQLLSTEDRAPDPATHALLRRLNAEPEENGQPKDATLVAELVGREREFASLLTAFQDARRGSGRVVSIVARAGLGKTRLLLDLARRLAAGGIAPAYVRAQPGDRDMPGSYAAEVARQLASRPGARGVSPGSAGSLVALNPSLSSQFTAPPDPSIGDEARRRRVGALAELIESVADERPLALLLDDLHWADAHSRDVLAHAIPRARNARVFFALAARPGVTLNGLEADETIELHPLSPEAVQALVASLGSLPADAWGGSLAAHLHAAAEGSPLLLLETLQLALDTGALNLANGTWGCPDEPALLSLLKAGSAVDRRIGQLDRQQSWLLLLLALGGLPLGVDLLAAASGSDPDRLAQTLDVLERRGMITRHESGWSVAHDEIAERAETAADARQVEAAHGALGRAQLAVSHDRAGLRLAARHLAATSLDGDLSRAGTAWVREARQSGDRRPARVLLRELIGPSLEDHRVRRIAHTLPWRVRANPRRWWAGTTVAAGVAVTALVVTFPRTSPDDPGVVMGMWVEQPGGGWRMKTHELTGRDLARGTIALTSFKPSEIMSPNRPEGVTRPGAPSTVATTRAYPDSGGLDVVLTKARDAQVLRITNRPGDDFAGAWSPDGRYLAVATDRWAENSRSNLAVLTPDQPDSAPLRLTANAAARDATPLWSPDGTRIAFVRTSYGDPTRQLCLVSVDGHSERCLNPPGYAALTIAGWVSSVEVVGAFADTGGTDRIVALNTVTGGYREVVEGLPIQVSHVPGWIACFCRRNAAEPLQALVIPVARPDRAIRIEPDEPAAFLALFPSRRPRSYLDRLKTVGAANPIPVDGTYQFLLKGWDAAGRPTEPLAVRWTTSDTTVATVDSVGVVHPRREGRVIALATAGGWRSDTAELTIGAAEAETVAVEDWREGITGRWVPFGEPQPFVAQSDRGPALAPNGDSTNQSGVYLRRRVRTAGGIGVDLDVSTPLTSLVWQNLHAVLLSADSLAASKWDLRAGDLPRPGGPWRACEVYYPATESEQGQRQLSLESGIRHLVSVPFPMRAGRWTRIRLQFFPDGHCGVAIDGVARAILGRRVSLGDSAMLLIYSYSHRTQILVGRLEVWTGVRRDVDWDAVAK